MLVNTAKLDSALDRAIEASADHSLWPAILEQVAEATEAFGVNILSMRGIFPGGLVMTDSLQPAIEGYFDGGWHTKEWRVRGLPLLKRQGTVLEQHYTTRDEFKDEEYYRAQSKYGLGRTCVIGISNPSDAICFALHRRIDEDPFDIDDEQIFRAVRDRLMVSASIMRNAASHRIEGMREAFEVAKIGAVFFDRFGKVTTLNDAASAFLGRELQVSGGELRSRVHAETVQIKKRMAAVLTSIWLNPELAKPILVQRIDARPILLRIQRLGGNLPDVFSHSAGVCLIEDLDQPKVSDAANLAHVLGLTKAEAALAATLANGVSLRGAAEKRAIGYETARTQLRSIFSKTSTRNQQDLVALIARLRTMTS
ncbi:DNA-binding CsgD family transcriptional regulator [Pseudaminobacter salicylatoxidans]|uniref:DNA-binding CsgD family transcriptional regulator n=1 Tax=Pseudaminobacter salicylatoxidans TaxID=93369 RepID=A0A316C5A9_PSESE|nr:hypothetical protein [Pseudaminobacter salicylatoxidans]PWJ84881.1 DNA-binding CsgD family transcriptional regulator [Pseudaminobacter salicylatoxidans]